MSLLCAALTLAVLPASAGAGTMSVQVKNGELRETPTFLGKVVSQVSYGDQVQVNQEQGAWVNVTASGGKTGWIHNSALTQKHIEMNAGNQNVQTAASGDELALASKGFNSDVEAEFKSKNKNIDFTWVDHMIKWKVTPPEMMEFLKDGAVKPSEGGAP